MRTKMWTPLIAFLLFVPPVFGAQRIKEKDLNPRYQEFLKLTSYIMLDKEKEVFLQLSTDRDREAFIETFWKQRDPTPGTPQNEYREEHQKRVDYANRVLGRSVTRPGWMTDQGKYYIILGPPMSIERFPGTLGIYPCEVWYYYGDPAKGLPVYFALTFWQKGGVGEWKLFDPVSDGPGALLIDRLDVAMEDYEEFYMRLKEVAPTLADVAFSRIPGEIPFNFVPSPRNYILLADIEESPKTQVNPTYATHFLSYKGMVSSEYMTNFIQSDAEVALIRDPISDLEFIHYSIVPKSLSVDYYEPREQYFCNFTVNTSLRIGDNIIFQHSKEFPFYFSKDEIERVRASGLAIEDSLPVIKGDYRLIVLLQNSVGKEFSLLEQDVSIPEESDQPAMSLPLLGYDLKDYDLDLYIPFKILGKKLVLDPKETFAMSDTVTYFFTVTGIGPELWENGSVRVAVRGLKPNEPVEKSYILRLRDSAFRRTLLLTGSVPASELVPDYYEVEFDLLDGNGDSIDVKKANFVLSPVGAVSHPIAFSKALSRANSYFYHYMQANQYDKIDDRERAEAAYRKAFEMKPDFKPGLVEFANFLIKIGKYSESMELADNLKDDPQQRFSYYAIRGRALTALGNYAEAIAELQEGNKIYNSDTSLLYSLGFCYLKTGEKKMALDVLRASLSLNPDQENVKSLIAEVEKE